MKRAFLMMAAAATLAASATPALARQGCGIGFHRDYYGYCVPNRGRRVIVERPVIGVYYHGRGWWDGHHYWRYRYRWHHAWRYR